MKCFIKVLKICSGMNIRKEIAKRRVIGKSRRKFLQFAALPLVALKS